MAREMNYLFGVKAEDGRKLLNVVGNTTAGFPFLCEGGKGLITPFYLNDGVNTGSVSKNTVIVRASKAPYACPDVACTLKNLRVPTIAANISEANYEKAVNFLPEIGDIPKSIKPDGGITVFVPIIAFNDDAVFLHKCVGKGDTVAFLGELKPTKITALNRVVLALWCIDVRKIKTARGNLLKEGESVD